MIDYEKAYKDALERAKMILCNIPEGSASVRDIETIFPELRESEDERIRKEIIHYILYKANGVSEKQEHEWIAYLEKQKEPHYTKRNALFDKCVENCDPATMKRVSEEVDAMLEKEQKPAEVDESTKRLNENWMKQHFNDYKEQEQPIGEEYAIGIGKHTHILHVGSQSDIDNLIRQEKQGQPEVFDTVAFQKGVQEGRRLEKEDEK